MPRPAFFPGLLLGFSLIVLCFVIAYRDSLSHGQTVPARDALKITIDAAWRMVTLVIILGVFSAAPVGSILFVGCAVGKVSIEQVMRKIWPFYAVMFLVLMFVSYIPEVSLWLPRHVLR